MTTVGAVEYGGARSVDLLELALSYEAAKYSNRPRPVAPLRGLGEADMTVRDRST